MMQMQNDFMPSEMPTKRQEQKKPCEHIAVVMDGNRRFGSSLIVNNELGSLYGHILGAAAMVELFWWWINSNIKTLSVYGFAIKNEERKDTEKKGIRSLIITFLDGVGSLDLIKEKKVRIKVAGNRSKMPPDVLERVNDIEQITAKYDGKHFYLCAWYDGNDEIERATRRAEERGEKLSLKHFDVPELVDLFVRPTERRLSGFLPYQSSQAEIRFYKKPFPLMTTLDWSALLTDYYGTERRFGV